MQRAAETGNVDQPTVEGFGAEWSTFTYESHDPDELKTIFDSYFSLFPWSDLPDKAIGFDAGCGSGRWASLVAPRIGVLHCVDASPQALAIARNNVGSRHSNCRFHTTSIEEMPLADASMDFGYSLGVLHHVPDTASALRACVTKLKPGAPFLLYVYYALDNRPAAFRALWRASNVARHAIARLPMGIRLPVTQLIAGTIYWPLARAAKVAEQAGYAVDALPLASYRDRSFYVMRTDALDRFGTRLEKRFTREQVYSMMSGAGLERIAVQEGPPYWTAIGYRRAS